MLYLSPCGGAWKVWLATSTHILLSAAGLACKGCWQPSSQPSMMTLQHCAVRWLPSVEFRLSLLTSVRCSRCALLLGKACRPSVSASLSSSLVTGNQFLHAQLLHGIYSCNCEIVTHAMLLLTPAVLQVTHAMGLSDQLLMAELQQTRADADHGPHKLIAHPVMRTMWHQFFSAERVDCATFWAAFLIVCTMTLGVALSLCCNLRKLATLSWPPSLGTGQSTIKID